MAYRRTGVVRRRTKTIWRRPHHWGARKIWIGTAPAAAPAGFSYSQAIVIG